MTVDRTKPSISGSESFCPGGSLAKTSLEAAVRAWLPFWQMVLASARYSLFETPLDPPPSSSPQAAPSVASPAPSSRAAARIVLVRLTGSHATSGGHPVRYVRRSMTTLPGSWAAHVSDAPDRPVLWEERRGWVTAGDLDRASRRLPARPDGAGPRPGDPIPMSADPR